MNQPKRIVFPARGEVRLESFELPKLTDTGILARVHYSLMSIGTETTILGQNYDSDSHFARMFSFPQLQTGVQSVGEIVATGREVDEFSTGDFVYLRMGHASHVERPAAACSPIPAGVPLKSASWCGLAKTAFRAAWAGRLDFATTLLIIGAGPVGQMAVRWAKWAGASVIAVADVSTERLRHAQRGGATHTFAGPIDANLQAIGELHGGLGPSVVIDSTGNAAVFQCALAAAAHYGTVILLGDTGYPGKQRMTSDAMVKGLTIIVTHDSHDRDGWTQRRIDELFFERVMAGQFSLDALITREFRPEQCAQAYAVANEQRETAMGILFDWTGN